ncbi:bZIP family protein [Salix suchowensis]|nr:bZIP family protein [Salix suchowensis]
MRCNSCWRELEGRAVSTTCSHLLCIQDRVMIMLFYCPICDQVLSKSLMKPVEINPNDEWINVMMKSAYRSLIFFIGQRELEMQYKTNRMVAQCRQKCESMQEKKSSRKNWSSCILHIRKWPNELSSRNYKGTCMDNKTFHVRPINANT